MIVERELKPIVDQESYHREALDQMTSWLYWVIFKPVADALGVNILPPKQQVRYASRLGLADMFSRGDIYFLDGYIYGSFRAEISRQIRALGGRWDAKRKAFRLSLAELPYDIRQAIAEASESNLKKLSEAQRELQKQRNPEHLDFSYSGNELLNRLEIQAKKVLPSDLEIPMELSSSGRNMITGIYQSNLELGIKKLSEETTGSLRQRVMDLTAKGYRADKVRDMLRTEYNISLRRARFIARQETSLAVSAYRQTRYTEAGINSYRWQTSKDERVRDDHKKLDGRVFSWDEPPVVDTRTGRRGHPGQDFGCRCLARPLIKTRREN